MTTQPAPSAPDAPAQSLSVERLLAECATTSDVLWLVLPDGSSHLAWHAWDGERILLLTGPGEQVLPPLPDSVEVVLRSATTRAGVLSVPARVRLLAPSDEGWDAAASALRDARLNAPAGDVLARWRAECSALALDPEVAAARRL